MQQDGHNVYGYCPECGGPGVMTEKRMDGFSRCASGHEFLRSSASKHPIPDLTKAHVKGYSKKDGTYVRPHERGPEGRKPEPHHHPRMGDDGKPVLVKWPHHPSAPSTWHNPNAVATFVPDGDVPREINGVPLRKWRDHPTTLEGWNYADGVNFDLHEPPFHVKPGKKAAAGVVVEEPDGRTWLVHPTNGFGGYDASWPKGTVEDGLSLQASALKECFEEAGLKVRITGFIADVERTTSVARFYRAVRVGGDPTDVTWEMQATSLVPKGNLYEHLNMATDHGIAELVGAGPAPKPLKSDEKDLLHQKF